MHPSSSPLIIGVTGHRDIHPQCIDRVRLQAVAFVEGLKQKLPHTELRVMVGMAEGADLLVAQAALERGIAVDAVLPMPVDQYADDFGESALALLHTLLSNPQVRRIELGSVEHGPGHHAPMDRDARYVALTESLTRKSNLLVALWDGEPSSLPGGTADTVLKYLGVRSSDAGATEIRYVDRPETDGSGHQFVYWITVSRSRAESMPSDYSAPCYLSAVGQNLLRRQTQMPVGLRRQLEELDEYNREYAELLERTDFRRSDTLMRLVPDAVPAAERIVLERIDEEYTKSDALAVHYQRYSDRLFKGFSLMASAMGLLFLVYAKLVAAKIFIIGYLILLLAGLAVYHRLQSKHWFSKHLVYRVLAETMRTKFFLRLAAADHQVNAKDLIRLTGVDNFPGFSWITNILKSVEPFEPTHAGSIDFAARGVSAVQDAWIRDQQSYFHRKVVRLEHTDHKLERMKGVLFFVLAAITIILVLFSSALTSTRLATATLKDVLMFVMGLLPVWLGIWEIYQNKMATRELLWQYRNQLTHFAHAQVQLDGVPVPEQQAAILADLGRKSLMESYLWTIHRFHREHEPPSVG